MGAPRPDAPPGGPDRPGAPRGALPALPDDPAARRVFTAAHLLAAVALVLTTALEGLEAEPLAFNQVFLPLSAAAFVALAALRALPGRLPWLRHVSFATILVVFFVELLVHLAEAARTTVSPVGYVTEIAAWAPALLAASFLLYGVRAGAVLAAAVAALTSLAYVGAWTWGRQRGLVGVPLQAGADLALSLGLQVGLLTLFARLWEGAAEARAEARTQRELAITDDLTGLRNRRWLQEVLEHRVADASRYGGRLAVVLIDLDDFKRVNDVHGHDVGDEVLRGVARVLGGGVREADLLGRWGGEEFLVVCPATPEREAARLAERLRASLAARDASPGVRVTASFGVAEHRRGDDLLSLMRRADGCLYRAKEAGKDRVERVPPREG